MINGIDKTEILIDLSKFFLIKNNNIELHISTLCLYKDRHSVAELKGVNLTNCLAALLGVL